MSLEDDYKLLLAQVKELISGEKDETSIFANVSAALHDAFPDRFFWVGFYFVKDDQLALGPFQGTVACYHIPFGKGVCGTAWQSGNTIIVPDVESFPGHIACSSLSRSEIVVPIKGMDGQVKAILDIDSVSLDSFNSIDQLYLEQLATDLSHHLRW